MTESGHIRYLCDTAVSSYHYVNNNDYNNNCFLVKVVNNTHALSNWFIGMCLPASAQGLPISGPTYKTGSSKKVLELLRRCRSFDVLSQCSKGSSAEIKQLAQHSAKS